MRLRIGRAWILAGLAAAGVVLVQGSEAHAKGGLIVSSGTSQQSGDPMYNYIFEIDLTAGATLDNGGYITIYDLPGLTASSLTSQPSLKWGSQVALTGVSPSGFTGTDSPTIYNVTWQWNGASFTNTSTSSENLGIFAVGPTSQLASPPTPLLGYVGSLDGTTMSNTGTVQVTFVPEPSSVVLLLAGVATLPFVCMGERRRRERQSQSQSRAA